MSYPAPTPEQAPHIATRSAFVQSLVAFVLGVVLLEAGFRSTAGYRALASENFYTVKARWYSEQPAYDVVFIGDSRMLHGLDPRAVSDTVREETGRTVRVYNAGLSGAPPMAHLAWVARTLEKSQRPRLVVLSLSPNMFGSLNPNPPGHESLTSVWRARDVPYALRARADLEDVLGIVTVNTLETVRYRPKLLEQWFHGRALPTAALPGDDGYYPLLRDDPWRQDSKARWRLIGYAHEMSRSAAHFGNEHNGYFVECLRSLRAAGVRIAVIDSPSSSQLDAAYGPQSWEAEHRTWVQAQTRAYGGTWFDARHAPGITDDEFNDGDHFHRDGARKFSAWLARALVVPQLR